MDTFEEKYGIILPWTVFLNDTLHYQIDDKRSWNRFLKNNQIESENLDPVPSKAPGNIFKRTARVVKHKIGSEKPREFEKHRIKEIFEFRRKYFQNIEEGRPFLQLDIQLLETGDEIPSEEIAIVAGSDASVVMKGMLSRTIVPGGIAILIRSKEFRVEIKKDRIIQICDQMREFGKRIDFLWGMMDLIVSYFMNKADPFREKSYKFFQCRLRARFELEYHYFLVTVRADKDYVNVHSVHEEERTQLILQGAKNTGT